MRARITATGTLYGGRQIVNFGYGAVHYHEGMVFDRRRTMRQRANDAVRAAAARIDDDTGRAAQRAARTLVFTVGLLRVPTLIIGVASVPFIAAVLVLGIAADSLGGIIAVVAGVVMAAVSAVFFWRRRNILEAVQDEGQLATELAIMAELAGKAEETRGVLVQIAGGGGFRVFSRLRGLWSGTRLGQRWIEAIGDLPRAKWFGPPRIGTTVAISIAALWLIPVSFVACLFTLIAAVAGSL